MPDLAELHSLVTDCLMQDIANMRSAGEYIPPALYAVAIKFLKDNGQTIDKDSVDDVAQLRAELLDKRNKSRFAITSKALEDIKLGVMQ